MASVYELHLGRFRLERDMIGLMPVEVLKVMSKCIIFRAEYLFAEDCIEYVAGSLLFRESPRGTRIPFYKWYFENDELIAREREE